MLLQFLISYAIIRLRGGGLEIRVHRFGVAPTNRSYTYRYGLFFGGSAYQGSANLWVNLYESQSRAWLFMLSWSLI